MAFFQNKTVSLDELIDMTFDGQGPDEFSFLGIIDNQKFERDERHQNRIHHDLILHNGSKSRIHVQYITGHDDKNEYDDRVIDDSFCPFYPKASTCFLPRLEILFAENDELFCQFKGGIMVKDHMIDPPNEQEKNEIMNIRKRQMAGEKIEPCIGKRKIRPIGSNRVCLILDMQPSSIYQFLFHNEVRMCILNENYQIFSLSTFYKREVLYIQHR